MFLIPEKRDEEGLAVEMTLLDNLTLPRVGEKGRRWLIGTSWQQDEAQEMILRLGITPPRPEALVSTLSGGNQQKVLLGKWLAGRGCCCCTSRRRASTSVPEATSSTSSAPRLSAAAAS